MKFLVATLIVLISVIVPTCSLTTLFTYSDTMSKQLVYFLLPLSLLICFVVFHADVIRVFGPIFAKNAIFNFSCSDKIIALTIDDGPDPKTTEEILDILHRYDASATFFIIGERADDELLKNIVAAGHELGNHTFKDEASTKPKAESIIKSIDDTHQLLSRHQEIKWFRPGKGRYNARVLSIIEGYGYKLALGDVFPYDHIIKSSPILSWYIGWSVRSGSIIVLHDSKEMGKQTVDTLNRVLPKLNKRGYRIVSLSEINKACANSHAKS